MNKAAIISSVLVSLIAFAVVCVFAPRFKTIAAILLPGIPP